MLLINSRKRKGHGTAGNEKGQTLVEYGLILLLIAVVVIVMIRTLGMTTNNTYNSISSSVTNAAN